MSLSLFSNKKAVLSTRFTRKINNRKQKKTYFPLSNTLKRCISTQLNSTRLNQRKVCWKNVLKDSSAGDWRCIKLMHNLKCQFVDFVVEHFVLGREKKILRSGFKINKCLERDRSPFQANVFHDNFKMLQNKVSNNRSERRWKEFSS